MSATNVVLVHGAWADGSSWSDVIERLKKEGFSVTEIAQAIGALNKAFSR